MLALWVTLLAATALAQEVAAEEISCSASDPNCETQGLSLMQQGIALMQDRIEPGKSEELARPQTPFDAMRCNGTQVETTSEMTYEDYDSIVWEMRQLYSKLPTDCNGTACPQGDIAGCFLRLAAHDFMDYDPHSGEGGSDGCLSFDDPDNKGLPECLYEGDNGVSVADAYEKFCLRVSLADFLVIAGEALMTIARENVLKDAPSRSAIDFRTSFKYGRTTKANCANPIGLMPNPENGCDDVLAVFGKRMGLDWNLSAALMGAHTLGKAEPRFSGYNGSWVTPAISNKFDNSYYHAMLLKGWAPDQKVGNNPGKNQWQRVDLGVDSRRFGKEMMLNTDLCLLHSPSDVYTIEQNGGQRIRLDATTARSHHCSCAWLSSRNYDKAIDSPSNPNRGELCGMKQVPSFNPPTLSLDSTKGLVPGVEAIRGSITEENISLYAGLDDLNFTKERVYCCSMVPWLKGHYVDLTVMEDCGLPSQPVGFAKDAVKLFAEDEDVWLEHYTKAWHIATTNGHHSLKSLAARSTT